MARAMGLLFSLVFCLVAAIVGYTASGWYIDRLRAWNLNPTTTLNFYYTIAFTVLGGLVGFIIAAIVYRRINQWARELRRIPAQDKVAGIVGLLIGFSLTVLVGALILRITDDRVGPLLVLLVATLCIYLGGSIAWSMKEELFYFFPGLSGQRAVPNPEDAPRPAVKLLDTNVIIDGRIADISRAGFVEGPIYIPGFVLEELHTIADSADNLKRNRGRRGLDILNQMQDELDQQVQVYDRYNIRFSDSDGVDLKLVHLAKDLDASIVTNDFNLNKVAQLHQVKVLNVNELANALKPVVLPGEEMIVLVVKEGKEPNQGVAYLDDGTMVVVEQGKKHIGETIAVTVTSVLQTVAGKMIFAEAKPFNGLEDHNDQNARRSRFRH